MLLDGISGVLPSGSCQFVDINLPKRLSPTPRVVGSDLPLHASQTSASLCTILSSWELSVV